MQRIHGSHGLATVRAQLKCKPARSHGGVVRHGDEGGPCHAAGKLACQSSMRMGLRSFQTSVCRGASGPNRITEAPGAPQGTFRQTECRRRKRSTSQRAGAAVGAEPAPRVGA